MLALDSSFTSHLVPYITALPDIEATASRIMQFDQKGKCLTPEIVCAIIKVLKSTTTQLASKVNIFRNALVCGYERALLDRIEDGVSDFEPYPALCDALQDEGILLQKQEGALYLTRSHLQQETDPALQLASGMLSERGLPGDIVKLIVTKARITPKEKTGAIEQYLRQDISGWTQKQLNDALLAVFEMYRPLPIGKKRLEITDFEFNIPRTTRVVVPYDVTLRDCRVRSGTLIFLWGTVTSIHQDGIAIAESSGARAFAGVSKSRAQAVLGGTSIAIAEDSIAEAEGTGSRSVAKVPRSSAIAWGFAQAFASATLSSARAYTGGWAIAGAHSSALAINKDRTHTPAVTMTELQFSVFEGKSPEQRSTVTSLINRGICTPSVALSLPEGVLTALEFSLEQIPTLDKRATNRFRTLLQKEQFIEELGSLACQQQLKAKTISLHDLIQRVGSDSSGRSSSGSALSTSSSSSSSTSSGMST